MVRLIGGIEVNGELRKDVALKPLTGATELMLAELGQSDASQPEKVTRFLSETIASIGGQPIDAGMLSVGDRQHLVRQLGVRMGVDLVWLAGECTSCGESFEIPVQQADLPVKPAGPGFPAAEVKIGERAIRVRAPTGDDQAAIAGLDPDTAAAALLARLADGLPQDAPLPDDQRDAIEQAIEDLSPEVSLEVAATCPECEAALRVSVDPYLSLAQAGGGIFDDIHILASRYHWAEAAILALPRTRRQAYLARIDRDRGMMRQPDPGLAG